MDCIITFLKKKHFKKHDSEEIIFYSYYADNNYMKNKVTVDDLMQQGYTYVLSEPAGENFHPDFKPELTPKEMLKLGVFGGKYMTDCIKEFPDDWFNEAKLSPSRSDPKLNFFGVDLKDTFAAADIGSIDNDLAVETSRTEQCRIENIRAVGGGD